MELHEPEVWLEMPQGKGLGRSVSFPCFFPFRYVGILLVFGLFYPACNATSLGYCPFPLEYSTSTSGAAITILIFTIRACGPLLYQKEFPVNEVLITESCRSGGGGNSSLSLVQPRAALAWPAQR